MHILFDLRFLKSMGKCLSHHMISFCTHVARTTVTCAMSNGTAYFDEGSGRYWNLSIHVCVLVSDTGLSNYAYESQIDRID